MFCISFYSDEDRYDSSTEAVNIKVEVEGSTLRDLPVHQSPVHFQDNADCKPELNEISNRTDSHSSFKALLSDCQSSVQLQDSSECKPEFEEISNRTDSLSSLDEHLSDKETTNLKSGFSEVIVKT